MIIFKLGKWSSSSKMFLKYERLYLKGKWTPFCKVSKRYKNWLGFFGTAREQGMYIRPLPTLWYENIEGEKFIPDLKETPNISIPEGYKYQHSQFPTELSHNILRKVSQKEVDNCNHPSNKVVETGGWIEGVQGRECTKCGGTQVKKTKEKWSDTKWEGGRSINVATGHSSWPEDLAMAMANSGDYKLSDSILIAANSCSRCMNALAYQYGLPWGFKVGSKEWKTHGTSCDFCEIPVQGSITMQ